MRPLFVREVNNMNKTQQKLEYTITASDSDGISVIIVAAGSSSRMKGVNKQFLSLCGIPVIARTLMAFENCKKISNIILVAKSEDIFVMQNIAEKYMISKLSDIVCGGNNRQESVLKGMALLDKSQKKVLIHDGARPLVSEDIINRVAFALEQDEAVVCAVALKDTIKEIDNDGFVVNTPDRSKLFCIQTPQGVDVERYTAALEKADDLSVFTDDASIMEMMGCRVKVVEGEYTNIKVTTPEDIVIAEGYIKQMKGELE